MCGTETGQPKTVKIEGAELDVCADCADFGTEVKQASSGSTSTKYSTSASSSETGGGKPSSTSGSSGGGGSQQRRRDMFDRMDEVAQDYNTRIRQARESRGLSQESLASELNEKASLIRKLERGDVLPDDSVQRKLEKKLDISLVEGGASTDETDWSSSSASGGTTLGDVVKRKD
jgi:putative transcription factor